MCDLSGHLAFWLPCVAGSEFGVGRQPAALISREPDARVSGYLNVKFLEFGCRAIWVDVSVSRCGAPSVRMWRIRVCQPKDTVGGSVGECIQVSGSPQVNGCSSVGVFLCYVQLWGCPGAWVSGCGVSKCLDI